MQPTPAAAAPLPPCPRCGATHVVRNGKTQSGSPNLLCRGCGRCFVAEPKTRPVSPERKALVRRLLLERLSLRGIARAAGVSRSWAIGRTYFTCQSATFGLMTMSYFGRDSDRCSRASYGLISFAVKRTPVGYTPSMNPTAG